MKGTYYKTPIDFKALIEKRDLLATTAWGECKFDEGFGAGIGISALFAS